MAHNGPRCEKRGRNKKKCETYRFLGKHERSHIRRIRYHMKIYKDNSPMAKNALEKYLVSIRRSMA